MSVKDGKDYLYLIWKSEQSRKQYIVGRLTKNSQYEFRYSEEVQLARDDGYMLLKRSGARLPIDNLEFIDPILNTNENVTSIFFMAGVRHYLNCSGNDCLDAVEITRGDEVFLQREPANKYDENAVQMLDASAKVLGYIPRYYSKGVSGLLAEGKKIVCHIYNVDKNKNCNECVKVIMDMRH